MIIEALDIVPNKDVVWWTSIQPDSPYNEYVAESPPGQADLLVLVIELIILTSNVLSDVIVKMARFSNQIVPLQSSMNQWPIG